MVVSSLHVLTHLMSQLYEVNIFTPILEMQQVKHREVK